jgi:hypothetical protein
VGCFAGPLLAGQVVPARPSAWRWALPGHVATISAAYAIMGLAPNIYWVIGATALRTVGANNLWIDSTSLVQLRTEEWIKGHVAALELTVYTLCEGASAFAAGWLFDGAGLAVRQVCLGLSGAAAALALLWLLYAAAFRRRRVVVQA